MAGIFSVDCHCCLKNWNNTCFKLIYYVYSSINTPHRWLRSRSLKLITMNSIRFHIARRTGRVISLKNTLLLIDQNILGGREINLNKRQKMWKIYWLVQHSDFTELHSWEFYERYKILNTEMFPNVSLQIYCP